jgi:hypothetical protein
MLSGTPGRWLSQLGDIRREQQPKIAGMEDIGLALSFVKEVE